MLLGYVDVDKSHDGTGGWGTNYYDDLNDNGEHDPGEPFADTQNPTWGNTKSASDGSCWFASACNMLQQLGKISDANALYNDYCLNGVSSPSGTLTWDDGGLHEYAIQQWMNDNPAQAANMTMVTHWRSFTVAYSDGMFAWEDMDPRQTAADLLAAGWEVGIGIWPLNSDETHSGGHALTMQEIPADGFSCTDSDRDEDWYSSGDLNSYADDTRGPTSTAEHDYYAWYNDFYDGSIVVYPAGDVGYLCAVIPEPGTVMLLAGGMALLLRRRRKTAA